MSFASRRLVLALVALVALAGCGGGGGQQQASEAESETVTEAVTEGNASISFVEPTDGATVTSPVAVQMVAEAFTIEPAGAVREGAGHFHIMIDTACVEPGQVIPNDDTHKHYGQAQTETTLELPPGEHSLCLQAGDGAHTALPLTDEVTFTVE